MRTALNIENIPVVSVRLRFLGLLVTIGERNLGRVRNLPRETECKKSHVISFRLIHIPLI